MMASMLQRLEDEIGVINEHIADPKTAQRKRQLYSEVGSFLVRAGGSHWWCSYTNLMVFMLRLLELYHSVPTVQKFYDTMAQQLARCRHCVDAYHASIPAVQVELEYEYTPSSVQAFFSRIGDLDAKRIQQVFALACRVNVAVSRQQQQHQLQSASDNKTVLSTTLYEILNNRRLFSDFRVLRVFAKWLSTAEQAEQDCIQIERLRSCSGLYQLLVSPVPAIRDWATGTIVKLGRIELLENGEERVFLKIFDEWMFILENNSFNLPVLELDLPQTQELSLFLDRANCIKTPTDTILWASLDKVMQRMDGSSLEIMLQSFENLPDVVFNNLFETDPNQSNQRILLVLCNCFNVMMRCLSHRFWKYTIHSPSAVIDAIKEHCTKPHWREFVMKGLIELFPTIIMALRPPHSSSLQKTDPAVVEYFSSRRLILRFLLDLKAGLVGASAPMVSIVVTRVVSMIIRESYEPRLASMEFKTNEKSHQDGALPDSCLTDTSVSKSAFWWPCGKQDEQDGTQRLWEDHLFETVVDTSKDPSLVDHVALTCSIILRKHLRLLRDWAFEFVSTGEGDMKQLTQDKPIATRMFEKLASWKSLTTIPLTIHGVLFECVGGIGEIQTVVGAHTNRLATAKGFSAVVQEMDQFEKIIFGYLQLINQEVNAGLANPLMFPVVAQHVSICMLGTNETTQKTFRELINSAARGSGATFLELFITVVQKNPESFLRGLFSMMQCWRQFDFALELSLPALRELAFAWTQVVLQDNMKLFDVYFCTVDSRASQSSLYAESRADVQIHKLPNLINEFIISTLTRLNDVTLAGAQADFRIQPLVDETIGIRILDLSLAMWCLWLRLKQSAIHFRKNIALITPLIKLIEKGTPALQPRAVQMLKTLLDALLKNHVLLDEKILFRLENVRPAADLQTKVLLEFPVLVRRFRDLEKSLKFFEKRPSSKAVSSTRDKQVGKPQQSRRSEVFGANSIKSTESIKSSRRDVMDATGGSSIRPMSSKAAFVIERAKMMREGRTIDTSLSVAPKNQHSFYSEDEYLSEMKNKSSTPTTDMKTKVPFNLSDYVGKPQVTRQTNSESAVKRVPQITEDKTLPAKKTEAEKVQEGDDVSQLSNAFWRIKLAKKSIASCSLVPFYREFLKLMMPSLLLQDYLEDRRDRQLVKPSRSFEKASDYVNAFMPLLLEECSSELNQALEMLLGDHGSNSSSDWHLLRYESESGKEGMRCLVFTIVKTSQNTQRSGGRNFNSQRPFRNCDVVLFRVARRRGKQAEEMQFIGIVVMSEMEKTQRRNHHKGPDKREEEAVKVMFLNDAELEGVTEHIDSFSSDVLSASALSGGDEWKVTVLCNLITSCREYQALRSVDHLPDHLRTTILTPDNFRSTQSDALLIASTLEDLRSSKKPEDEQKVEHLLRKLGRMDMTLLVLRSTSIGKAVNKLRKHPDKAIQDTSAKLVKKWTKLMDQEDSLSTPPRFVTPKLWEAVKCLYNQSQLQSVHNVLSNYTNGVSLLQGPPGTGKTKTIMGLLSCFLTLEHTPSMLRAASLIESLPAKNVVPTMSSSSSSTNSPSPIDSGNSVDSFSIGDSAAIGSILRRVDSKIQTKPMTIQAMKNNLSVRSRLEKKLTSSSSSLSSTRPPTISRVLRPNISHLSKRMCHVLLCAPSNGAVDELVLRIVTDGIMDATGTVVKVGPPNFRSGATSDTDFSIVRLGNALEDAPEHVKAVCLPQIIRTEMELHPKTLEIRKLEDQKQKLRESIQTFHAKKQTGTDVRPKRKELSTMHQKLNECTGRIRRLRSELINVEAQMATAILTKARIIACTLSKCGSGVLSKLQRGFDALIIDEAAQAVELSTLVAIRERVARVVLVGDPLQLPATVKSVAAAKARYDRSLFERIAECGVAPSVLRVQYRMHPFLREFPSKRFYGGLLTDGPAVVQRIRRVCKSVYDHACFQPFLLYDLTSSQEQDFRGSKFNAIEARFAVQLCTEMYSRCSDMKLNKWSIGFVSPYKEQVKVLRQEVQRSLPCSNLSVEVNTVDGFQGREKDVIIFSCVRSSRNGGIGFLKDVRRLNVAITRARFCLFVIGNAQTLQRDQTWNALVKSAAKRKLIIKVSRGESAGQLVTRLEQGNHSELMQHYRDMHTKLMAKAAATKEIAKAPKICIPESEGKESTMSVAKRDELESTHKYPVKRQRGGENEEQTNTEGSAGPRSVKNESLKDSSKQDPREVDAWSSRDEFTRRSAEPSNDRAVKHRRVDQPPLPNNKRRSQNDASRSRDTFGRKYSNPYENPPTRNAVGMLRNILGTASDLARSTSQVPKSSKNHN